MQGPYFDEFLGKVMAEQVSQPLDLMLGRKTFEIFASYWPQLPIGWWIRKPRPVA
jgi:hypothetical protein